MMLISDLDFAYAEHAVFAAAHIAIPERGVTALRGGNGVGKTTLLKVLGALLPSRNASLQALRSRQRITYLDTDFLSLDTLTTREYLQLMQAELLTDDPHRSGLIEATTLDTRVADLSLGQRQRCVLALALALPRVDLLLLDEPLNGLDADASSTARNALLAAGRNRAILLATHEPDHWTDHEMTIAATGSTLRDGGRTKALALAGHGRHRSAGSAASGGPSGSALGCGLDDRGLSESGWR